MQKDKKQQQQKP